MLSPIHLPWAQLVVRGKENISGLHLIVNSPLGWSIARGILSIVSLIAVPLL